MALDPRISLAAQPRLVDFGKTINTFQNALLAPQQTKLAQAQLDQQIKNIPLQNQLLQQRVDTGSLGVQQNQLALQQARQQKRLSEVAVAGQRLKPLLEQAVNTGDTSQAQTFLTRRLINLQDRIKQGEDIDTNETVEALTALREGRVDDVIRDVDTAISIAQGQGLLQTPLSQRVAPTASQRDFDQFRELQEVAERTGEQSDIVAAEQFGRQAGFLSKEGQELSGFSEKEIGKATDLAQQASANINKFNDLANQIESSQFTGGVKGQFGEFLKDLTGNQNELTQLRRRFNAIKGGLVVNNLPPGAASDKDIDLALRGFPSERANKEEIASFLRGMAKIEAETQRFNNAKADYISDNGSIRGFNEFWRKTESKNISFTPTTEDATVNLIELSDEDLLSF